MPATQSEPEQSIIPVVEKASNGDFEKAITLDIYAQNEEVAASAVFLVSDESSFITGTVNAIDGGMTA